MTQNARGLSCHLSCPSPAPPAHPCFRHSTAAYQVNLLPTPAEDSRELARDVAGADDDDRPVWQRRQRERLVRCDAEVLRVSRNQVVG
eukprot:364645-Chlamydomonas_euryale.AAC.4